MPRKAPALLSQHRWKSLITGLVVAVVAGAGLLMPARPAAAHDDGGLFQPYIQDFVIEGNTTPAGRSVWVRIIDADSGEPAEGVRAALSTGGLSTPLADLGLGYYTADLNLPSGKHNLAVSVKALAGGMLTRELDKTYAVDVPAPGTRALVAGSGKEEGYQAALQSPARAARVAAAEQGKGLMVHLEPVEDASLSSPLYVRVHVHVMNAATNQLDPTEFEVFGYAIADDGTEAEFARFNPLDVVDPQYKPGIYGGVVILPHGGKWDMKANVLSLRRHMTDPPIIVTTGSLPIERQGKALARSNIATEALSKPKIDVTNTTVLAVHTLVAALWAVIVGAFLMVAFQRARALSTWGRDLIERHLEVMIKAAWISTAIVVGTGVWNMYRESPYRPPGSLNQLDQRLDLPFGKQYFISLGVKLLAYAVLLYCSYRLIHSVKTEVRGSGSHQGGRTRAKAATAAQSPWNRPGQLGTASTATLSPLPQATGARAVGGGTATAVLTAEEPLSPADPVVENTSRFSMAIIPVMALAGATIIICVTILKTAHTLIEVARITQ